jgi:hypothetical protein
LGFDSDTTLSKEINSFINYKSTKGWQLRARKKGIISICALEILCMGILVGQNADHKRITLFTYP